MIIPLPFRLLLWPFSVLYGVAAELNEWLYAQGIYTKKHLNTPVVSVGNLTVGGTGKTPMVLWLAERFLAEHKRVAILSRGYRGSGGTSDEVEMLKARLGERVFFGTGPDRYVEGRRIESERHVDLFLLDDGFQHLELARDVDIVLVDSTTFHAERWLLPAGGMREPLSALRRASAVVLTRVAGDNFVPAAIHGIQKATDSQIFCAATKLLRWRCVSKPELEPVTEHELPPQPVFAFCGIGNPDAFFSDVKRWGLDVVGHKGFRDHHSYTPRDKRMLEGEAGRVGARALLTTEKDIQNLKGLRFSELPLYFCEIAFEIAEDKEFCELIRKKLAMRGDTAA